MRRLRNQVLETSPFRTSSDGRSCEAWDPILDRKVRRPDGMLLTVLLCAGMTLAAPLAAAPRPKAMMTISPAVLAPMTTAVKSASPAA